MRHYLKALPSGVYYICWVESGRQHRITTGCRDRSGADLALAKHILEKSRPVNQALGQVTLEGVLVRYWQGRGKHTFSPDAIRTVIKAVSKHLPGLPLDQWTIGVQEDFVAKLGVSESSQRRYMGVIAAALHYAHYRGEIQVAPPTLKIEENNGPGARPLGLEELRRLFGAANMEHQRRLLVLALVTGARPGAILQLTWDRIRDGVADFDVPGRKKTKKRRTKSPLPDTAARWLEDRRSIGPVIHWAGKPLKNHIMTFKRLAARAKVDATAYGVRKAVATWLRRRKVDEWEVGAALGHRVSRATTETYAQYRPDYMLATKDAVEELLGLIGAPWLASYSQAAAPAKSTTREKLKVSNGLDGSREWDRTTDHFHVKDKDLAIFQSLKPANDDNC